MPQKGNRGGSEEERSGLLNDKYDEESDDENMGEEDSFINPSEEKNIELKSHDFNKQSNDNEEDDNDTSSLLK